jgi:hypothetical protein
MKWIIPVIILDAGDLAEMLFARHFGVRLKNYRAAHQEPPYLVVRKYAHKL